jgi:hypothetical protein
MRNTKFMNKIKILVISGLMFFSGTYLTTAQEITVLSDNIAKARLVAPLVLSTTGELNFGGIVLITTAANDVVMAAPNAARTFQSGVARAISTATEVSTTPTFSLSGEVDLEYFIVIPADGVVKVTLQNAANTGDAVGNVDGTTANDPKTLGVDQQMDVKDFNYTLNAATNHDVDDNASSHTYTANTTFKMGATLAIGANQIKGNYKGSYQVTVAYE